MLLLFLYFFSIRSQAAIVSINGIVDDENSQAEGTIEGAVGYVRIDQQQPPQQQSQNNTNQQQQIQQPQIHPHYENIYECIEQYNAAARGGAVVGAAVVGASAAMAPINAANISNAPAEEPQQQQQSLPQPLQQPPPPQQPTNENNTQQAKQSRLAANNINYRNDLYDRANAININAAQSNAVPQAAGTNNNNYDIPRSVRSGLGFRRNFQLDLHAG